MAETAYPYSISTDFPNEAVNSDDLTEEVDDSAIVTALTRIETSGDTCNVVFVDALSGGDETILDGLVAAHQGTEYDPEDIHVTGMAVMAEATITSDATYDILGAIVVEAKSLSRVLSEICFRVMGEAKTNGAGVDIRIVEKDLADDSEVVLTSTPHAVPDQSDAWKALTFDTDVTPKRGPCEYRLEGRLDGATSASVRYAMIMAMRRES